MTRFTGSVGGDAGLTVEQGAVSEAEHEHAVALDGAARSAARTFELPAARYRWRCR
jgi:hypothetical protein